jgi:hypothetical protein
MSGYDSESSVDFEAQVLEVDRDEYMGDGHISPVDYMEEDTPAGSLLATGYSDWGF